LDSLSQVQQEAIRRVFTEYTLPMPGTQEFSGKILIEAVTGDNLDPNSFADLALPFTLIGLWQWGGHGSMTEIHPLDESFIHYLPDIITYDPITLAVVSTTAPVLHEPHRRDGWPAIIFGVYP